MRQPVPQGWVRQPLGEVVKIRGGFAFKSKDFVDLGIPVLRISNITPNGIDLTKAVCVPEEIASKAQDFFLQQGQVVIAMSGATTGKTAVLSAKDVPCLLNQRVGVLSIKNKQILSERFLKYVVQSDAFRQQVHHFTMGGVQPNIRGKQIESVEILVPPFSEQEKMADILHAVDEVVEKTKAVIQQKKKIKKGMMQRFMTRGIGHSPLKKTEIGKRPVHWTIEKAGTIAEVNYGISESVSSNTDPSIGIPILTGANITLDGQIDPSKLVYIKKKKNERFILRKGDLLFNWRSGSQQHVGKTAIFDLDGEYTFASFILRIRVNKGNSYRFYYYLLNYLKEIGYFSKKTSMQVNYKLNATTFRHSLLPRPPLHEQQKIAEILYAMDQSIQVEQKRYAKLQSIKRGLLQSLLSGTIRVNGSFPKMPNEEPCGGNDSSWES